MRSIAGCAPARISADGIATVSRAVAVTQESVVEALEACGVTVLGAVQDVLNAVFARATAKQAEALCSIPAVAGMARDDFIMPSGMAAPTVSIRGAPSNTASLPMR